MVLEAERPGEFIDAFLLDHGRIHVGQEQALAAVGVGRQHGEVDGLTAERRPQALRERGGVGRIAVHEDFGGDLTVEDAGGMLGGEHPAAFRQHRIRDGRAVRVCYQDRDQHAEVSLAVVGSRGAPGGGSHRRPDRLGQVGLGEPHRPCGRRCRRQHGFDAGLCGSARSHRPARCGRGGGRAAPALRPCGRGDELLPRPFRPRCGGLLAEGEGRMPVFVGGTGLYFRALEQGFSELPPVPEAVRAEIRRRRRGAHGGAACRPRPPRSRGAARLRPSDRMRVMRALEILAATGRPIASFYGDPVPGPWRAGIWSSCSSPPTGRSFASGSMPASAR